MFDDVTVKDAGPTLLAPFLMAEKAERVVARVYDRLSTLSRDNRQLRELFARLAREERAHAARIQLFAQLWHERGHAEPPGLDLRRVERLIQHAERYLASLETLDQLDARAVMRSAIGIEQDFGVIHAEYMCAAQDPQLADFFGQLLEADHAHATLLSEAKRDFKFDGSV